MGRALVGQESQQCAYVHLPPRAARHWRYGVSRSSSNVRDYSRHSLVRPIRRFAHDAHIDARYASASTGPDWGRAYWSGTFDRVWRAVQTLRSDTIRNIVIDAQLSCRRLTTQLRRPGAATTGPRGPDIRRSRSAVLQLPARLVPGRLVRRACGGRRPPASLL